MRFGCYVSATSRVQLSRQISFGKSTVVKHFALLQTQGGKISIGKICAISAFDHISTGIKDVVFGDYVRVGPHVTILGGGRNFKDRNRLIINQGSHHKGTTIGSDVLIGAGAVILPGCNIGEGAVIGALCLVNRDLPPYSIVAGIPAKIIGSRE